MQKYFDLFLQSYANYANYLLDQILYPSWHNYFYWVVGSSFLICVAEKLWPWRKNQGVLRKDFFLDLFYIFWNYFLFSLVLFNGLSNLVVQVFNDFLGSFGMNNLVAIQLGFLPDWSQLIIIFVIKDFLQYLIHRLLHHVTWMWQFHKIHHSTQEMGFGALMRYHFMEHIFYRTFEYIPLAMLGFGIGDFFIVHIFTFITGQLGHANLFLPLGKFKYILNGPQMHLLHHAKEMPKNHPKGFNYGISLSIWDYLFGTVYWPKNNANLVLGLPNDEYKDTDFKTQQLGPFTNLRKEL